MRLNTVQQLVDVVGREKAGEMLGVTQQAIWRWTWRGGTPSMKAVQDARGILERIAAEQRGGAHA